MFSCQLFLFPQSIIGLLVRELVIFLQKKSRHSFVDYKNIVDFYSIGFKFKTMKMDDNYLEYYDLEIIYHP